METAQAAADFWQIVFEAAGVAVAIIAACAVAGAGAGTGVLVYRRIVGR